MKKYYELVGQRIVACLDWADGFGTEEDAKNYFSSEFREITKKEFEELGEEYSR